MVSWANGGYGGMVQFLMLCVETGDAGLRTAKSFGQEFQVPSSVVNAYIENVSELPKYGQLGCGGFIVLGPYGEIVAARTVPAYLQKGPLAFTAVEQLLSDLGVKKESVEAAPTIFHTPKNGDEKLQLAPVGHIQMDNSTGTWLPQQQTLSRTAVLRASADSEIFGLNIQSMKRPCLSSTTLVRGEEACLELCRIANTTV